MANPVDSFVNGACGAAGVYVTNQHILPTAQKIDRINKDMSEKRNDQMTNLELGLVYGGIATSAINPPIGMAMGTAGVALQASRVAEENPDQCKVQ